MPETKFYFGYFDSIFPSICLLVLPFTSSSRKASTTTRISWRSKNCVVVVAATPTLSSLKSIWLPRTRVAHTSPLRPPLGSMTTLIGLESQSVAKLNLTNRENSNSVPPSNLVRLLLATFRIQILTFYLIFFKLIRSFLGLQRMQ